MTNNRSPDFSRSPDFYIFTSYLWEHGRDGTGTGLHHNLPRHRSRLIAAAQTFGWDPVFDLLSRDPLWGKTIGTVNQHLESQVDSEARWRKVKVCVYEDCRIHVESMAIQAADPQNPFPIPSSLDMSFSSPSCQVSLHTRPVTPSPYTRHKTSERTVYDQARDEANISHSSPSSAEVLLFNAQDEVSECSLSTPYFRRDDEWVTPPLSSGGNAGTSRAMALESGLCIERVVLVDSLRDEESIWISNGVRGFIQATLHIPESVMPKPS